MRPPPSVLRGWPLGSSLNAYLAPLLRVEGLESDGVCGETRVSLDVLVHDAAVDGLGPRLRPFPQLLSDGLVTCLKLKDDEAQLAGNRLVAGHLDFYPISHKVERIRRPEVQRGVHTIPACP